MTNPDSVLSNPSYQIDYTEEVATITNVVTQTVTAYKDVNGLAQNLVIGATSNLYLQAVGDVFITGSNSSVYFSDADVNINNSLTVASNMTIGSNATIAGTLDVAGDVSTSKDLLVNSNVISHANVYGAHMGVFRSGTRSNVSQVGYTWVINDKDQLELVKYTYFVGQSNPVCKKMALYGINNLGSNDTSDVSYNPLYLGAPPPTSYVTRALAGPYNDNYGSFRQLGVYFDEDGSNYYTTTAVNNPNAYSISVYVDHAGASSISLSPHSVLVAKRRESDDTLVGLVGAESSYKSGHYNNWMNLDCTPLPNGECLVSISKETVDGPTVTIKNYLNNTTLATIPSDAILYMIHMTSSFTVKGTYYVRSSETNVSSAVYYNYLQGVRYYLENNTVVLQLSVENVNANVDLYWGDSSTPIANVSTNYHDAALTMLLEPSMTSGTVTSLSLANVYKVPSAGYIQFVYYGWGSGSPLLPTNASSTAIDVVHFITIPGPDISSGVPDITVYNGFDTVLTTVPAVDSQDVPLSTDTWMASLVTRISASDGSITDAYVLETTNSSDSRQNTQSQVLKPCMMDDGNSVLLTVCNLATNNYRYSDSSSSTLIPVVHDNAGLFHSVLYKRNLNDGTFWTIEIYFSGYGNYGLQSWGQGRQIIEKCPDGGFIICIVLACDPDTTVYVKNADDTVSTFIGQGGCNAILKFSSAGQYLWSCLLVSSIENYAAVGTNGDIYIMGTLPGSTVIDSAGTSYTAQSGIASHIILKSDGTLYT